MFLLVIRIVVVALVLMAVYPARADFAAGQRAWDAGNVDEALSQWRSAADEGNRRAMLVLGRLHLQGLGVTQDYVEAHKWFNLAASLGEAVALEERDALAAEMTPAQIATAQERAAAWRPGQHLFDGAQTGLVAGDTFRDCEGCPEMVVVPAGNFIMGSPEDEKGRRSGSEGPQHRITISRPFAVGKYEITRRQFGAFISATRYNAGTRWRNPVSFKQTGAHPVVNVSWDDAQAYVSWLSRNTGQQYRLLSEVEWEYAARAGTTTRYHFGNTIFPSQANYGKNNGGTVAVGNYPANKFGLHDMHGNVWEWVEDCWHSNYNNAPTNSRAWVSYCSDDRRVRRGGSWYYPPRNLRSAYRGRYVARDRGFSLGIRVARTLKP